MAVNTIKNAISFLKEKPDTNLLKSLQYRLSLYNNQKIYTDNGSKG